MRAVLGGLFDEVADRHLGEAVDLCAEVDLRELGVEAVEAGLEFDEDEVGLFVLGGVKVFGGEVVDDRELEGVQFSEKGGARGWAVGGACLVGGGVHPCRHPAVVEIFGAAEVVAVDEPFIIDLRQCPGVEADRSEVEACRVDRPRRGDESRCRSFCGGQELEHVVEVGVLGWDEVVAAVEPVLCLEDQVASGEIRVAWHGHRAAVEEAQRPRLAPGQAVDHRRGGVTEAGAGVVAGVRRDEARRRVDDLKIVPVAQPLGFLALRDRELLEVAAAVDPHLLHPLGEPGVGGRQIDLAVDVAIEHLIAEEVEPPVGEADREAVDGCVERQLGG